MKHPVLTNRARLIIWWLVWLFVTSGQLFLFYFAYGSFTTAAIPDGIISLVIYSGIGLSLWFPFRYLITSGNKISSIILWEIDVIANRKCQSGCTYITPLLN